MYCIAIESELKGTACPLGAGRCMWQHLKTNACTYTDKALDSVTFAKRTGKPVPSPDQVQTFVAELRTKVYEVL